MRMSNVSVKHRGHLSERERQAISHLHQLLNEPGLLRASFVRMKRSCGRDYCRCMRSKAHRHESTYVVQRHQGKPRMKHLGSDQRASARQWIERYRRIRKLLDTVSDLYWQELKKR